ALLLGWAIQRGGGLGNVLTQSAKLQTSHTPFWTLFPAALTANVGYWATLSLNIPDFTRYARSQRSQALGQAMGLPATMTAFAFIGVAVTSATMVLFGEAIWDPVVLIARIGSAPVIIFGALVIMLAQLTTKMAANDVSHATHSCPTHQQTCRHASTHPHTPTPAPRRAVSATSPGASSPRQSASR